MSVDVEFQCRIAVAGLVWFLPFLIQREGKISKFDNGQAEKDRSELPNKRLLLAVALAGIVYWCMRPPWEQAVPEDKM